MTDTELIEAVSDQYRRDGYTVARTSGPDLGTPMAFPDVDLIATKGDEVLAIELQEQDDRGFKPVVVASGRRGDDNSLALLAEAERLLTPETQQAALLMAWTAFEAAARERLSRADDWVDTQLGKELIRGLAKHGHLNLTDFEVLRRAMALRDLIAHGVRPADDTSETTIRVLDVVRKLKSGQLIDRALHASAHSSLIRKEIAQDARLGRLVLAASGLLEEVLGPSSPIVAADWSLVEDGQGRRSILLKLSDFTGSVSGLFTPEELTEPRQVKMRFYRLWGELLQIRITQQLENLIGIRGSD